METLHKKRNDENKDELSEREAAYAAVDRAFAEHRRRAALPADPEKRRTGEAAVKKARRFMQSLIADGEVSEKDNILTIWIPLDNGLELVGPLMEDLRELLALCGGMELLYLPEEHKIGMSLRCNMRIDEKS